MDEHLSWHEHIEHVCLKLTKLTSAFYSLSRFIDEDMAKQIYYAFVYPHIIYGIESYGSASVTALKRLQIIQNKLLKILCRKDFRYNTNALHRELGLLTIKEIYELRVLCFVYKQRTSQLPIVFNDYFKLKSDICPRTTRQSNDIHVIRHNTNIGKASIRIIGATFWNKLPQDIRTAYLSDLLKKCVKDTYCKDLSKSCEVLRVPG